MTKSIRIVRSFTLLAGAAIAQPTNNGSPAPSRYGLPIVVGAPYSADETRVMARPDGEHLSPVTFVGKVFRDWRGRTRTERPGIPFAPRPGIETPPTPLVIEITDPIAGFKYILDQQAKIAHRIKIPPPVNPRHASTASPGAGSTRTESLGAKTIEGLLVNGSRSSSAVGSGKPEDTYLLTSEMWSSPDLMISLYSKVSDPRHGDWSTTISNINRAEPNPRLFQPPPDYKVVDDPASP